MRRALRRAGGAGVKLGVLGGGQLGRMLALAAIPLDIRCVFYGPDPDPPAGIAGDVVQGAWEDERALARFAAAVDVVTLEFENVPLACAEWLAARRPMWPAPDVLAAAQDRVAEKCCFRRLGIATPPFAAVDSPDDARRAAAELGAPGILKTRRFGYDGKGQLRVADPEDAAAACAALGGASLIYERAVEFERELSIIAARGTGGEVAVYPLIENHHSGGILDESIAPAPNLRAATERIAMEYITALLQEFRYVGVLALELFETRDGVLANEMAPRVHNSGHWTIEGATPSQFESHVRAVCGLPVQDPVVTGHARMINLIGALPRTADVLAIPGARLHLYGKRPAPRRKVGHVTVTAPDAGHAAALATRVRGVLPESHAG